MKKSDIDTNTYKAHSARAAATAGFKRKGMSLKNILAKADWSHKRVFTRNFMKGRFNK